MSLGLRSHSELHNLDQRNSEFFEAANWVRPVSVYFHVWPSSATLFELKLNRKVDELQITLRDFETQSAITCSSVRNSTRIAAPKAGLQPTSSKPLFTRASLHLINPN